MNAAAPETTLSEAQIAAEVASLDRCVKCRRIIPPGHAEPVEVLGTAYAACRGGCARPFQKLAAIADAPQISWQLPADVEPLPFTPFNQIEASLDGNFLVENWLPSTGLAVVHGHPGCGKTFFTTSIGLHIATGQPWFGLDVEQGGVVYVVAEGARGFRNRIEAFRRENGVEDAPFFMISSVIDLCAPDADVLKLIAAVAAIERKHLMRIRMVVIDTLSRTFGSGSENGEDMVAYLNNCALVAEYIDGLTLIVHHRPKDAETTDPRGHGSIRGNVDAVILIEGGETKKATLQKLRDGEAGLVTLFRLRTVELGRDRKGRAVTSCVVEPSDACLVPNDPSPAERAAKLPDSARLALRQLDELLEADGIVPPAAIPDAEINRFRVGKVVEMAAWRAKAVDRFGQGSDTKPDSHRKAFERGVQRLEADGIVKVFGGYAWRTFEARTSSDNFSDTDNAQVRTTRTKGFPPTVENPRLSECLSGVPAGHCPEAEVDPSIADLVGEIR